MNLFFTLIFATCAFAHPQRALVADPLASPLKLSEPPAGRGWGSDEKTETLPIEVLETQQVSISNCALIRGVLIFSNLGAVGGPTTNPTLKGVHLRKSMSNLGFFGVQYAVSVLFHRFYLVGVWSN